MAIPEEFRVDSKWTAERLGVSPRTLPNLRRCGLLGEQDGTGSTSPWSYDRRDVERLAEQREREKRMRHVGGGFGEAGREAMVDAASRYFGWSADDRAEELRRVNRNAERQELFEQVERAMAADSALRRRFEALDEGARFEAEARELAERIRHVARVRARAQQILDESGP